MSLRSDTIRLAYHQPSFRPYLLPLLADKVASLQALKKNIPSDPSEEESKAFAQHLADRTLKDFSSQISKGVSQEFDRYYPTKKDFSSFLEKNKDVKFPNFQSVRDNSTLIGSIPGMKLQKVTDGIFEFMRSVQKLGTKSLADFARAIKNTFKNWAKKKIKDKSWAKLLDKSGLIDLSSKAEVDYFPRMHRNWDTLDQMYKKMNSPDSAFLNERSAKGEKEYADMILSYAFEKQIEKDRQEFERNMEDQAASFIKGNEDKISKYLQKQIKDILDGKSMDEFADVETPKSSTMGKDALLNSFEKNIQKALPAIKKEIDTLFEGKPEARKAIANNFDSVDVKTSLEDFLIPTVVGGIKAPTKTHKEVKKRFLGIPTVSLVDVQGILEGKYEPTQEKKEKPEEEDSSAKFEQSMEGKRFPNPNPEGRSKDVTWETLESMDHPKAKEMVKKIKKDWRDKQGKRLRKKVIRLAYQRKDLQPYLLPLLTQD